MKEKCCKVIGLVGPCRLKLLKDDGPLDVLNRKMLQGDWVSWALSIEIAER
jgi:hypothetical protein